MKFERARPSAVAEHLKTMVLSAGGYNGTGLYQQHWTPESLHAINRLAQGAPEPADAELLQAWALAAYLSHGDRDRYERTVGVFRELGMGSVKCGC